MRSLWMTVVLASGRGRAAAVVAGTAVVTGLLLVAVSYARLSGWDGGGVPGSDARLLAPIEDGGTRGGAILGVVLLVLPVVLLLDQCARLGSTAQRRRYRALMVAGATRRDLGRWGAIETGVPALVGAVLGVLVWLVLRLLLGTSLADAGQPTLVPTATGPGWWALLAVLAVAAYGVWLGRRAAARLTVDRQARNPRPWGPILTLLALVLAVVLLRGHYSVLFALIVVVVLVIGFVVTTPWLAYVLSGRVLARTEDPAELFAARRIRADRGAAGRAAAAVSAVGLAFGVTAVLLGFEGIPSSELGSEAFDTYLLPTLLAGFLTLLALGVITLSLSLHSVEATYARRRELAALVASGVSVATLERALRAECRLVTLPVSVGAALVGALVYGFTLVGIVSLLEAVVAMIVMYVAVTIAIQVVSAVVRPAVRDAVAVGNLRTE